MTESEAKKRIYPAAGGVVVLGNHLIDALESFPDPHRHIIDHLDADSAFHASLILRQAVEIARQLDAWSKPGG